MLDREIHKLLEGAAMKGVDFYIPHFIEKTGLDYRTSVALLNFYKDDINTGYTMEEMIDKSFYTVSRMIEMERKGFEAMIPPRFYENEVFLETLEIDEIPEGLFCGNYTIKQFKIDKRIRKIGSKAFKDCDNLECVIVEERDFALDIGNSAFENCIKLKKVTLNADIEISDYTFAFCLKLSDIDMTKIKRIGMYSFLNCISIRDVSLSDSVKAIFKGVFCGCIDLQNIDLKNIESIESEAFKNCKNLTQIDLSSVQKIEAGAFAFSPVLKTHRDIIKEKIKK